MKVNAQKIKFKLFILFVYIIFITLTEPLSHYYLFNNSIYIKKYWSKFFKTHNII